MKTKTKNIFKSALSLTLALVMVLGIAPICGLVIQVEAQGSNDIIGELITFGSYPQTKVTKSSLKAALGEARQDEHGNVEYAGEKYLRYKTSNGSTEFYKYEPIQWRILSNGEDGLFVVAEKNLDRKQFSSSDVKWSESDIKTWLNTTFYDTAFSVEEKAQIRTSTLITDRASFGGDDVDTLAKVFLLSYQDVNNAQYKLNSDELRRAQSTDYAKDIKGFTGYWLRTPGYGIVPYYVGGVTNMWEDAGSVYDHNCPSTSIQNMKCTDYCGIRPAIKLYELPKGTRFITDEEYIREHVNFDNQKYDSFEANNGFYNTVWSQENGKRLWAFKTWDIVGDIGEIATFNFDDLTISADYYQLFLADIIMMINGNNSTLQKDINLKAFEFYNKSYGDIEKILKSTDEWKNSITSTDKELEIKGFFTDPDYQISENTELILRRVLKESFEKNADEITNIFSGLNAANDLCDYILKGDDIVKAFKEANDAYTIALSFKNANSELFNILYSAINEMEKTNSKYAEWFRKALNKYYDIAMNDKEILTWSLSLTENMGWMTYDLAVKKHLQNWSYNMLSKVLGCDPGKLGMTAFWLTFSYNTTYKVLNKLLPMGKASTPYYFMTYIAPFEYALSKTVKIYGNKLQRNKTYENAMKYDFSYSILKATNTYLYECSFDFCSVQKEKEDMKYATYYKNLWVDQKCHSGILKSNNIKYVSIQCPVDVYVYDAYDNLVLSIVNENIVECDPSITVMNYDGKKSFCYSSDESYRVEIIARMDGNIDYYISDMNDGQSIKDLEFYDVPISKKEKFVGSIPNALEAEDTEYQLKSSLGKNIDCDYNSSSAITCADDSHQFSEWTVVKEPNCFEFGVEKRSCSACKKTEYRGTNKKHIDSEIIGYKKEQCDVDGYTGDKYCKNCGDIIEKGEVIKAEGHLWSDWSIKALPTITSEGIEERICKRCSKIESRNIPKLTKIPVDEIKVDKSEIELVIGDAFSLIATVKPDNATYKSVYWSSSDTSIATVDENGVVTAVAPGEAEITVTTVDGGFTDSCRVRVYQPVQSIEITCGDIEVKKGKTAEVTWLLKTANATDYECVWSSSDESVATVDERGVVTGVKKGEATVTLTVINRDGSTVSDSVNITVKGSFLDTLLSILLTPVKLIVGLFKLIIGLFV